VNSVLHRKVWIVELKDVRILTGSSQITVLFLYMRNKNAARNCPKCCCKSPKFQLFLHKIDAAEKDNNNYVSNFGPKVEIPPCHLVFNEKLVKNTRKCTFIINRQYIALFKEFCFAELSDGVRIMNESLQIIVSVHA